MAKTVEWKPRGVVHAPGIHQESPAGRHLPDPPLDTYLEHFWSVSWDLRGREPITRETLPHPSIHLVFEAGRSGLGGVSTGRFIRVIEGRGRVFGIKFLPGCFRPFWRGPVAELTDRVLGFEEAFGIEGLELEAAITACEVDGPALAHAEAFLLSRLPPPDPDARLACRIVARILEDRSLLRAEAVAEASGLGLRSLQRLFAEYVGVSPKWVIQRYRLHEAMARLDAGEAVDLPALALDLGYYDQAHFIRDFKALLGRTPAAYARSGDS